MTSKIRVTNDELLKLVNAELKKETFYKDGLEIMHCTKLRAGFLFEMTTKNKEDVGQVLSDEYQDFAERMTDKYELLDN